VRPTALLVLSSRKEWSLDMLRGIEAKQIPRTEVPFEVIERLRLYSDSEIASRLKSIWGTVRQTTARETGSD